MALYAGRPRVSSTIKILFNPMEIKPPSNIPTQPVAGSIPVTPQSNISQNTLPPDWKVSQLIDALITKVTDKQLFMMIQGTAAHTVKPATANIQPGDSLKLQITQLNPQPQFKIIEIKKALNTNLILQTLKNLTAQQPTSAPLMKNLAFVATRPALRPAPLAVPVNAAIRELFRKIPSPLHLKTASQLKTHIANSGIFVEGKIKNQVLQSTQQTHLNRSTTIKLTTDISSDLRTQLIRLADLIRSQSSLMSTSATRLEQNKLPLTQTSNPIPTQQSHLQNTAGRTAVGSIAETQASLQNVTIREEGMQTVLRQIESSLNQMQQTQLQSLNDSQTGRPVWIFELPIKDGQDLDLFKFRISQDDTSGTDSEVSKSWSVILEFNFEGLGQIKSHIRLQDNLISALFFSEQPQTLALFNDNFDYLRSRFNSNGLNVGSIEIKKNIPGIEKTEVPAQRLDERT